MAKRNALIRKLNLKDALFFFGPLIAFYAVFYLFSTGFLIYASLHRMSISLRNPRPVGLENFQLLLTDPNFLTALQNNIVFALVAIIAGLTLGFFIAVTLSAGIRAKSLLYVVFLLPTLMPLALIASVFRVLLESRFGGVNEALRTIGLDGLAMNWLIDPTLAFGVVCILFIYMIGLPVMYYTANLATINTSVLEAAVLDGARTGRLMREILFPLMKGTHRTIVLSTLLMSFRAFDIVFFSTQGGPAGATQIAGTYVYRYSTSGTNIGYGSAAALVVMGVALILATLQLLWTRGRS